MSSSHLYAAELVWTGDRGEGTRGYRGYDRTWEVRTPGKAPILCSNDPLLGGDPTKHNPEDMLLAALSACHMLWYLHLACNAGLIVRGYRDAPEGLGETAPDGAGRFVSAVLRPEARLERGADLARAAAIHHEVARYCFIARSGNFPVRYEPTFVEV